MFIRIMSADIHRSDMSTMSNLVELLGQNALDRDENSVSICDICAKKKVVGESISCLCTFDCEFILRRSTPWISYSRLSFTTSTVFPPLFLNAICFCDAFSETLQHVTVRHDLSTSFAANISNKILPCTESPYQKEEYHRYFLAHRRDVKSFEIKL